MHLVGFIIRIYHNARSYGCQIYRRIFSYFSNSHLSLCTCGIFKDAVSNSDCIQSNELIMANNKLKNGKDLVVKKFNALRWCLSTLARRRDEWPHTRESVFPPEFEPSIY